MGLWNHASTVMKRIVSIAMVSMVILTAFGAAMPMATAQNDDGAASNEDPDVAPGERLAGVIAVQDAEIEGEVAERTFGVKVARAASDDARADVVGDQVTDVEERLERLEQRTNELQRARERGDISEGEYRAEMARIAVERKTAERLAERSEVRAGELPADLLDAKGIDVEAIQMLRERAGELGGTEVAEIARGIAGANVGERFSSDAGQRGGADGEVRASTDRDAIERGPAAGNVSDDDVDEHGEANLTERLERAEQMRDRAQERIERAEERIDGDDDAQAALNRARTSLQDADEALGAAREASDENASDAIELADQALERAEEALDLANEAIDSNDDAPDGTDSSANDRTRSR